MEEIKEVKEVVVGYRSFDGKVFKTADDCYGYEREKLRDDFALLPQKRIKVKDILDLSLYSLSLGIAVELVFIPIKGRKDLVAYNNQATFAESLYDEDEGKNFTIGNDAIGTTQVIALDIEGDICGNLGTIKQFKEFVCDSIDRLSSI